MTYEGSFPPEQAPSVDTHAEDPVFLSAVRRLGMPFLIFGATFLLLVIGITYLITPDRFPVYVGDKAVRLSDLEQEEATLQAKKAALQEKSRALDSNNKAPVLQRIADVQKNIVPVGRVLVHIEEVRAGFTTSSSDPISLPRVDIHGTDGSITLGGTVMDPGGRSMQILASFVDGIRAIPMVETVTEPEYISRPRKEGGTESPFVVTLKLRHE